ncbi:MAG TPA: hypothetical protein VNY05_10205 [Candidatus Acidoferrales bacterium]|jgi:hypothetical protein|nr:hypothetical protein [Candidatus Acidoferrales bacterium]
MVIRYSDGSYVQGVIHRLQGGTVRAAVAGVDDAIEYRLIRDQWTSEMGVVVTFEFILDLEKGLDLFQVAPVMIGEVEASRELEGARCAAGGDCVLRRMSGSGMGRVN